MHLVVERTYWTIEGPGSNGDVVQMRLQRESSTHDSYNEVVGVEGGLDLTTQGVARVLGLAGPLTINTNHGHIEVDFAYLNADSHVRSHHGSIELAMPAGSRFNLETKLARYGAVDTC